MGVFLGETGTALECRRGMPEWYAPYFSCRFLPFLLSFKKKRGGSLKKTWIAVLIACLVAVTTAGLISGAGTVFTYLTVPDGETNETKSDTGSETTDTECTASETEETEGSVTTEVHVIDVGQGLCVLVKTAGGCLLYDGGGWETSEYVLAYLRQQGVTSLNMVISSHHDSDHQAGLIPVLEQIPCNMVLMADYDHDSRTHERFLEVLEEKNITASYPSIGDTYTLGDISFTVICPTGYDYADSNNQSIGIRLWYGDTSIMITGDAELESELDFTEYCSDVGIPLTSTVLIAGHHGSGSSTSSMLLDSVNPEKVVISCGTGNAYGHPAEQTLERIKSREIELYRTDLQGTILFYMDGTEITVSVPPCTDWTPGMVSGSFLSSITTK